MYIEKRNGSVLTYNMWIIAVSLDRSLENLAKSEIDWQNQIYSVCGVANSKFNPCV